MGKRDLLPTTVVGSYPQPDWLIDREKLLGNLPFRVRAAGLWRVPEPWLEQAQDDATIMAIHEMERAGIDIISDGEMRRESYSNRLANALGGVDRTKTGHNLDRTGKPHDVPLVSGPIRRLGPVEVRDLTFLRQHTSRRVKITLPGPFTMTQQAENAHYPDEEALAMDFAAAVNAEIKDLFAAGADVVQIDDPYMEARYEKARQFGIKALNRALEGVQGITAVHLCMGYAHVVKRQKPNSYAFLAELEDSAAHQISIEAAQPKLDLSVLKQLRTKTVILGVLDLNDPTIETPATVAERIRAALKFVEPDRLVIAPDCGMKYLPRAVAWGKLKAMVEGVAMVRDEL
ncbi:MAG: 5-methyltetrahydropteroyltriglutamate--homocysteine methyltransferase [Candidatus Binataceae bacterium]|nr:5-methyltetrahydropteroyltriglutamate--homocysteine methyltransferase [Candidatus Binataceae bacterium]